MSVGKEMQAFYQVGKREYEQNISKLKDDPNVFYNLLPAIVNLAFSIELALKTFLKSEDVPKGKDGHNLFLLFNKLDGWLQPLLIDAVRKNQAFIDMSDDLFGEYLDRNKDAFQNWRYYYEIGGSVDITFLYVLATVLYKLVNNTEQVLDKAGLTNS